MDKEDFEDGMINVSKRYNQMRISIVIPIYNVELYITDCLQSVMRQTYQGPLECIMVDDCGSDNSIVVAENLVADYDGLIEFKILHHEHNRGLSAARNSGMDAATGEYVYFLDSDDWISEDCIEKLTNPLQKERFDIVVGDYEIVGTLPYFLELSFPEGHYHEKGISKTFCNQGVYVMAVNKLYNKKFLQKNHLCFEEGKVHEDEILAFELSCIEKSFYVVKSVTYFYRIRENSIVTLDDPMKKIIGYLGVLQSVKEKVKRYKEVEGIYDFYVFWIARVFRWISRIDMDEEMQRYVQNQTKDCFDVVPSICYLQNKHNRLAYFFCMKNQTYSRFQYVTNEFSNKIQGRVIRNVLNLLPVKC